MVPSQSCVELKVFTHSDVIIYLMLLNTSSLRLRCFVCWNHCNVTKIWILEHSKIAKNVFLLFTFFSFFYKQQETYCLKYFKKSRKGSALDPCNECESIKNDLPNNITANDLGKVQESLKVAREEKKKRTVYVEKDKQEIPKDAAVEEWQWRSEDYNQSSQK